MALPVDSLNELINRIWICREESQVDALLDRLSTVRSPTILSFVNAHAVNLAKKNIHFRRHLMESDILLRDGSGMATLFKWLSRPAGINLNGTDLIPRIVSRFQGSTVALFGTQEPWLSRAENRLQTMGVPVTVVCNGYQDPALYREILQREPADLVILGMGMPKQEAIAIDLRNHLIHPCLIVNGGAILDFLAGRFPRAPHLLQVLGMEWSYRLWKEPRRLFRRYVVGNITFLLWAIRIAWAQRSQA